MGTKKEKEVIKTENFTKVRKKRKTIADKNKEFLDSLTPSKYQEAIFDFVKNDVGNLVIEACSGSGKTTTLVKCLSFLPEDKKILFAAFNKDIVNDIKKKIKGISEADVRTIHSLGYIMIRDYVNNYMLNMDEYKYIGYINQNIYNLSPKSRKLPRKEFTIFKDNLKELISLCRLDLCQNEEEIEKTATTHDIGLICDEPKVILKLMSWGKNNIDIVDFTDLVWLPNVIIMSNKNVLYDYIFLDEVQDLSKAQREMIFKCFKKNTRAFYCGDTYQTIYSFAGASSDSMDFLKRMPNTKSLPLSISYRCPKKVVEFAKTYSPNIEYAENAIDGAILEECSLSDVKDGDAIICRNNAPLMEIYTSLLKDGRKSYFMGKDVGDNLIGLIKGTYQDELNVFLDKEGVFSKLYERLLSIKNNLVDTYNIDIKEVIHNDTFLNLYDSIKALEILSNNINDSKSLINKIKIIFSDKAQDGIILSSAHKSKGREFNNVYIACNSLFNKKGIEKEWEAIQEKNLAYVAYTRTKNILGFLKEDSSDLVIKNAEVMHVLNNIENKIQLKDAINPIPKRKLLTRNEVETIAQNSKPKTKLITQLSSNKLSFKDARKKNVKKTI